MPILKKFGKTLSSCKCDYNFTCGLCLRGGPIITNPEDSFKCNGKCEHNKKQEVK